MSTGETALAAHTDFHGLDEDDDRLFDFGREELVVSWSHHLGRGHLRSPEGRAPGLHARATDVTELFADWIDGRTDDFPELDDATFKELAHELGTATFGQHGELYRDNTAGKTQSVARFRLNSSEAAFEKDTEILKLIDLGEHESLGWTGGVLVIGRVQLNDKSWRYRAIIVSCSGVQGAFDQLFSAAMGYAIITGWMLALQADDDAGEHLAVESRTRVAATSPLRPATGPNAYVAAEDAGITHPAPAEELDDAAYERRVMDLEV